MKKISRRKALLFAADLFVLLISCLLAYVMLAVGRKSVMGFADVIFMTLLFMECNAASLFLYGTYNRVWRYANIRDLAYCAVGVITGSFLCFLILLLTQNISFILFFCVAFLIAICAILGVRLIYLYLLNRLDIRVFSAQKTKTLIVGAGMGCQSLLNEIFHTVNCEFEPICIVDDDKEKISRSINGIKIYGPIEKIPELCATNEIETIIFAIPSCKEVERRRILNICSQTNCKVKILPYIHRMMFKKNLLSQTTDIRIEDLLGRDSIELDTQRVETFITGKICMVTGGGGSIGSELSRQIIKYHPKLLIIVDLYENNAYEIQQELIRAYGSTLNLEVQIASVRDYNKMEQLFNRFRPDILFHAAAHKHVPLMETNPEEAIKNNVFGTFHVATLANKYHVKKFVMVSTDKAVNPTNVMGATKRCCEMIMQYMFEQSTDTEYVAVRFGNVLGSNGSVIPLFRQQIEEGGPVTVTHPDIIRYFMTIPEAVSLILQAGAMAKGGEIFVLDMGVPVRITTLAENLIRLYGKEPYRDIKIEYTGLRPGEKLFEELLMGEEGLKSTMNQKIFIGNQIAVDSDDFEEKINRLYEVVDDDDPLSIIRVLHTLVPTFTHSGIEEDEPVVTDEFTDSEENVEMLV